MNAVRDTLGFYVLYLGTLTLRNHINFQENEQMYLY